MAVTKYRSIADVPRPTRTPGDPENLRIALELSMTCKRLAGRVATPGLRRYRNITEAQRDRR